MPTQRLGRRIKGTFFSKQVSYASNFFEAFRALGEESMWINMDQDFSWNLDHLHTDVSQFHSFQWSCWKNNTSPPNTSFPPWEVGYFQGHLLQQFPNERCGLCVPDPDLRISSLPGGAVTRFMASATRGCKCLRECDRLDTKAESKGWAAKIAYSHPGIDRKEVSKLNSFLKRLIPLTTMVFQIYSMMSIIEHLLAKRLNSLNYISFGLQNNDTKLVWNHSLFVSWFLSSISLKRWSQQCFM